MLRKNYRLTKNKEFENIFKNGKSFYTKILGIKYIENTLNIPRFGILVSTKISKKAVIRNKIKRRLREILRLHENLIKPGYDIVVLTRAPVTECDYGEIEKNMEYAIRKAGLLRKII
ncbi:MAG: ribonuclease P protein component [bacterium]